MRPIATENGSEIKPDIYVVYGVLCKQGWVAVSYSSLSITLNYYLSTQLDIFITLPVCNDHLYNYDKIYHL